MIWRHCTPALIQTFGRCTSGRRPCECPEHEGIGHDHPLTWDQERAINSCVFWRSLGADLADAISDATSSPPLDAVDVGTLRSALDRWQRMNP